MSAIYVAAYFAIAFAFWTRVYRWVYVGHMRMFGSSLGWRSSDRAFGIAWGGVTAILWPLFLPVFCVLMIVGWVAKHGGGLFAPLERDER